MALNMVNFTTLSGIAVITLCTIIGSYLYIRKKKVQIPTAWQPIGIISKLYVYPLKSGHRYEVQAADCTEFGLQLVDGAFKLRDRSFVVYGENNGEIKTARTYPKFVLIESSVHDKLSIKFDAPGQTTLYVKAPKSENAKKVNLTLHGKEKVSTLDCGDEAASWFSSYLLDKPSGLRLGYHDGSFRRDMAYHGKQLKPYPKVTNQTTGLYSDLTSFHLITQASMDDLNANAEEPISVNQFRPNILVDGSEIKPFEEENWDWVKIGDTVMRNVKPCTRCIFTTINPETATRSSKREPLKSLEKHNILKDPAQLAVDGKAPVMGINLGLNQAGEIRVHDVVYLGIQKLH